jgi:hypothetical protein
VIVYDDRNGNGVLDFRHPQRQRRGGDSIGDAGGAPDAVYGASFISMTQPDRRVAFLEGDFSALRSVAFYPRVGCADPPKSFSILSAGGFSAAAALTSGLAGTIPPEDDPSACATATLDDTIVVPIPPQAPAALSQLACTTNDEGGVTYYRQAPADPKARPSSPIDLTHSTWACASFPRIGTDAGAGSSAQQLVVASPVGPGIPADPRCTTPSAGATTTRSALHPPGLPREPILCLPGGRAPPLHDSHPPVARQLARGVPHPAGRHRRTRARSPPRASHGHAGLRRGSAAAPVAAHRERSRAVAQARLSLRAWPGVRPLLRHRRTTRLPDDRPDHPRRPAPRRGVVAHGLAAVPLRHGAAGAKGLRFAGTIEPTWHATSHLSLAAGIGFGGIVEQGSSRTDPTPKNLDLNSSYTFPTPANRCQPATAWAWRACCARSGCS